MTYCSSVEQDCRGTCSVVVVQMLKAFSQILASRHSAAKGHQWTEKDSEQSSLISSNRSFHGTTHQVKARAQAQFAKALTQCAGNTPPTSTFPSSLQILAVSHLPEAVKSGYRQTSATSLASQPCRICKPSTPTSPL